MLRLIGLGLALSLVGCSSDKSGSDGPPDGRGSAACDEWGGAVCNWLGKCGGSADQVSTCRKQVAGITCLSDEAASNCTTLLTSNACTNPPPSCDIRDLADPAPAVAACDQYVDAVCSSVERCGESKADCLADPTIASLCTGAIAFTRAFESCIDALDKLECTATSIPAVCSGVILK